MSNCSCNHRCKLRLTKYGKLTSFMICNFCEFLILTFPLCVFFANFQIWLLPFLWIQSQPIRICWLILRFENWLSFPIPLQYTRFLHLVHNTGPVVVHCSAGIGRTGALITVDIVLAMVEKDLKFDIQKIVTDLRRQRQGMIQTKVGSLQSHKALIWESFGHRYLP